MHYPDFLPTRDNDLKFFAVNFSALIALDPALYHLDGSDSAALVTFTSNFISQLTLLQTPGTRTAPAVAGKNTARAALAALVRSLARRIQSTPSVTPAMKTALGLTVPAATRSPIPPPATRPVLSVALITGRTLKIRLADETTPTRRAKPFGVEGADLYSFVGPTPPADLSAWTYKGLARKSEFNVPFGAQDVGQIAHLRAMWKSTRGVNGPVSDEIRGSVAA